MILVSAVFTGNRNQYQKQNEKTGFIFIHKKGWVKTMSVNLILKTKRHASQKIYAANFPGRRKCFDFFHGNSLQGKEGESAVIKAYPESDDFSS